MEQKPEPTNEEVQVKNIEKEDDRPVGTETSMIASAPTVVAPPPPPPAFLPFVALLEVPTPDKSMKTLRWTKISQLKDGSVWPNIKEDKENIDVNYKKLEEQFSCKESVSKGSSKNSKTYLDSNKALKIDMFLKKFKASPADVVELIALGITKDMGHTSFKTLKENLPSENEEKSLKEINVDEYPTLSIADLFTVHLVRLPNYQIFIEAMVLQGKLSEMDYFQDIVKDMESACKGIMESSSLKKFLKYILQIGLFMNKGKNEGKANGFDILSLSALKDTKSKDESTTLLEYIIEDLQHTNPTCLEFVSGIKHIPDKTKRFSIKQVKDEFTTLKQERDEIMKKVNSLEIEAKGQFAEFEKISITHLSKCESIFERVNQLSETMARFFGLDNIDLDDLFCCFREFCEDVEKIQAKSVEIKPRIPSTRKHGRMRSYSELQVTPHVADTEFLQKLEEQKRRSESITT